MHNGFIIPGQLFVGMLRNDVEAIFWEKASKVQDRS